MLTVDIYSLWSNQNARKVHDLLVWQILNIYNQTRTVLTKKTPKIYFIYMYFCGTVLIEWDIGGT